MQLGLQKGDTTTNGGGPASRDGLELDDTGKCGGGAGRICN